MSNQAVIRIKNFQADYDFRICNLSVSIYCIGKGNLVLDVTNKQTKELVLENVEVSDGTQSIQCDLDNGIYNFKIYEVFNKKDSSSRYLLYEANFTYSNPYDAKDGEIIIKNIKYKGDEYALRYYYKITDIIPSEENENVFYAKMVGYDKFDILKSINDPYEIKITYLDEKQKEIFIEFEEDGEYMYFLFHRDKRMLIKEEDKNDQINYDRYFELTDDESSYLTTNYR